MNHERPHIPNNELVETYTPPNFRVIRVLEQGFGFGEGSISVAAARPETLWVLDQTIHTSPDILIPVQTEDDGCSDGRFTSRIFDRFRSHLVNLTRAKVFGGGVAMNSAINIGLGRARGRSLQNVFDESVDQLQQKGVDFGAHTDENAEEHEHGPNCGCGAIDKAPEAVLAIVRYEEHIRGVISALGVDQQGIDEVFENYRDFAESDTSGISEYRGSKVMHHILEAGKIIKRLGGHHLERRVILNAVRGYTVNQDLVRGVTRGEAQVFAIDLWRLEDIAAKATRDYEDNQQQALLSELVYTLGTAAVLTKGDLPVDLILPHEDELSAVPAEKELVLA